MKRTCSLALAGVLLVPLGFVVIRDASAQEKGLADQRIARLEQRIAAVEAENAKLREVVQVGNNKTLTIDGANVTVKSAGPLVLRGVTVNIN